MRRPGHKTILLLLAVLTALAVAGCGGGGGDETTDETATTTEEPQKLSKAELIEQGDGICAETNAAVGALSGEIEGSTLPETAEKTSNLYIGMVERLQELGAPEGAESAYSGFMEAAEQFAKVEGEVKLAIEREDSEALGEASTAATPALEEFETEAEAYGFEECSEGPQASLSGDSVGGETPETGEEPESLEEGGVEPEAEYVEPEYEEEAPPVEAAPETGGEGGGAEVAPETAPETGGGTESGGVGPG